MNELRYALYKLGRNIMIWAMVGYESNIVAGIVRDNS